MHGHKIIPLKLYFIFIFFLLVLLYNYIWATAKQIQQNDVYPAKTQISLGICMKKYWVLSYPLSMQRWLMCRLSIRWAHMPCCWFCQAAASICYPGVGIFLFCFMSSTFTLTYESCHDKTNKMACVPSEDSDQPGHPPSLIRVFTVHMKKAWVLSYPLSAQRRFWSDWADAQADLSVRWVHSHFPGFVMRWLIFIEKLHSIVLLPSVYK